VYGSTGEGWYGVSACRRKGGHSIGVSRHVGELMACASSSYGARPARRRSFTPGKPLRRRGGVTGGACAIASATPSAPLMPPGRRRTIPGTCEGTETPRLATRDVDCVREVAARHPFLAASVVAAQLPGTLAVRPGRDRARPAGPRAVSWVRSHDQVTTAQPIDGRAGAAGALIPLEPISAA
jgi:hypothetical protein